MKFLCFINYFVQKYFHGLGYPRKFLAALNRFYVPKFTVINTIHAKKNKKKKHGVQTACSIRGYHTAIGELLTRETKPRKVVGTYCGSKDGQFIGQFIGH